jgi:hypothetical protein
VAAAERVVGFEKYRAGGRPARSLLSFPQGSSLKGDHSNGASKGGASKLAGLTSRDDARHQFPVHIRQPEIAASVPISEPFMIQPEQVQNRRVQIVEVYLVLH